MIKEEKDIESNEKETNYRDITHLIKRIPSKEKQLGIEIKRLHANIEHFFGEVYIIEIFGEVVPSNGSIRSNNIEIIADAINKNNVIIKNDRSFPIDNIQDFESFSLSLHISELPDWIRLYPKKF